MSTESFPSKVEISNNNPLHTQELRGEAHFAVADPNGELSDVVLASGEPNPQDRSHRSADRIGIQDIEGNAVGNFNLVQTNERSWINDIEINPDRREEKLAVSAYLGIISVLHEVDRQLESDPMGLSEHSARVWESLVRRGVATRLDEVDRHGHPKFVSQAPERQYDSVESDVSQRLELTKEDLMEIGEAAIADEVEIVKADSQFGSNELEPPPGFRYNPDLLEDYEDQVKGAIESYNYQEAPIPSLEGVSELAVEPIFNPTNAPEDEIYAKGKVPASMRKIGLATHEELTGSNEPVEMWRIVERKALQDGTGLSASSILTNGSLGNVEEFDSTKHLASNHAKRVADSEKATPFVSFSTDPEHLAKTMILRHGFGVADGRDSVIVRVKVDPNRVITGGQKKQQEVWLLGGVAPDEYIAAYDINDFVNTMAPESVVRLNNQHRVAVT